MTQANEKYKGDALLQKTFCTDFLTKKMKVNEGEVPQYYVEHSHPAIIAPEVFDAVQAELKRRREAKYTSRSGIFSSRIICGECGGFFGPKVWHSNDKYRRVIWQCNHKYAGGKPCSTPHLDEDTIKTAFVAAFNSLITCKDEIIAEYRAIVERLTDVSELGKLGTTLQDECERLVGQIQKIVAENSKQPLDQNEYNRRYGELAVRYDAVKKKLEANEALLLSRKTKRERLTDFVDRLDSKDGLLTDFDEGLWNATVESATVKSATEVIFAFKGGVELDWTI